MNMCGYRMDNTISHTHAHAVSTCITAITFLIYLYREAGLYYTGLVSTVDTL